MGGANTSGQPLYASICTSRHDTTVAGLHLFGRLQTVIFSGVKHREDAAVWVNAWNTHLEKEWMNVRGTTSACLQCFVEALKKEGVTEAVLSRATKGLQL